MLSNCNIPSSQWSTQSPWVVKTTTTISTTEITQVLTKGKQLLADLSLAHGYAEAYHMTTPGEYTLLELYLLLYALESWDTGIQAMNFYDQRHLIGILGKIEQLFYICTINKSC